MQPVVGVPDAQEHEKRSQATPREGYEGEGKGEQSERWALAVREKQRGEATPPSGIAGGSERGDEKEGGKEGPLVREKSKPVGSASGKIPRNPLRDEMRSRRGGGFSSPLLPPLPLYPFSRPGIALIS
ncbi:hypothetical protein KTAU_31550 [Thermogemmatispora aurantia]|nr:hypothetical protein KTAU_31550 [Thermogemmatispora aurantia]